MKLWSIPSGAWARDGLGGPPPGLAGRHAQTIAGSLPLGLFPGRRRAAAALQAASTARLLTLAGGVRLMGYHCPGTDPQRGLVVLLHGWEGGANSGYMLRLACALYGAGYAIFRLNLRDHGGTHALNEELFHSGRIAEVVDAVAAIRVCCEARRIALVGYSLGGNFAMRVGARSASAGISLDRIVALCPVLHPPHTMHALETELWVYRRYYLSKWRRSLLSKQASFPQRYRLGDLRRFKTLTATTEYFVHEYTDYPDIGSYLNGYSIIGSALAQLRVPTCIIAAADDPIIPSADLADLYDNPNLDITVLPWGGHCGFVTDYRLTSRIDAMVIKELAVSFP